MEQRQETQHIFTVEFGNTEVVITRIHKNHQASMVELGEESGGVSDKSFKMLGVTRTLEAGASAEQVSLHRRRITMNMPLRYKHNSLSFKKQTAGLIPTD